MASSTSRKRSFPKVREDSGHMIVCKLNVALSQPYWHPELAKKHPETRIEVLGYSLIDDGMLLDLRVHVDDITEWIDDLRQFDDVYDVAPLGRSGKAETVRVTYKRNEFTAAANRLHLILRTPVNVKDGAYEVMMAGPEENVKRFIKMFHSKVQLKSVYDTERSEGALLTQRQAYVFRRAMDAGYFEVPRRITLTDLAVNLGVAVSSLSEMLAVVEKKLLNASQAAKAQ
jgi:predicted DNA binding protein